MYYVKMIDKIFSSWDRGKVMNYVLECETYLEAETVADNAKHLPEMLDVEIVKDKPSYNKETNRVVFLNKSNWPRWYQLNTFKGDAK